MNDERTIIETKHKLTRRQVRTAEMVAAILKMERGETLYDRAGGLWILHNGILHTGHEVEPGRNAFRATTFDELERNVPLCRRTP